jgi:hypothetical protein
MGERKIKIVKKLRFVIHFWLKHFKCHDDRESPGLARKRAKSMRKTAGLISSHKQRAGTEDEIKPDGTESLAPNK